MNQDDVRRTWAERSGEFSPRYYAYYGPDERSEAVADVVERAVGTDATVLELGCGSGRHLAHLHDRGHEALHGVDVNAEARDVLADAYPELAADVTFHADAIEAVVESFDDDQFDVVFSVETLQHLHPDSEWVFAELARITDRLLVTVENEDGRGGAADDDPDADEPPVNYVRDVPLYYRRWDRVFEDRGLAEVESRTVGRDTLRAFRPAE